MISAMDKTIHTPEQRAFLNAIRQLRSAVGLSQDDLARRLDEPQSFVSKYESGERRLDIIELRQICAALGVSLVDFVARLEEQMQECSRTKNS